jgi:hypothetical protein
LTQRNVVKSVDIYMQGYTHPREYIVTEWPVVSTCSDLWSLVYDHDCSAVVVLCNPSPGVSNVSYWNLSMSFLSYSQTVVLYV